MARRVFFSFQYADSWRANQVRQSNVVMGADVAGFFDCSEYEEAKRKGDDAVKRLILRNLQGTSVTVVLIGTETAHRRWIQFEIDESVKRNNGLLGITIHHLLAPPYPGAPGWLWRSSDPGPFPVVPAPGDMPVYIWDAKKVPSFARLIEEAGQRADALRAARVALDRRMFPRPGSTGRPLPSVTASSSLFDAITRSIESQRARQSSTADPALEAYLRGFGLRPPAAPKTLADALREQFMAGRFKKKF